MLSAKDITKYRDGEAVLESVDLDIQLGTITALIGPSGAGKTTLLNILSFSLLPENGIIEVDDKSFSFPNDNISIPQPSSQIAMVFQQLFLWPHLTLRENIMLPKKISDVELEELINTFGMKNFIDRYPNQTSLGQRQRAALARAIALKPRYLLLDEVTSALDIEQVEAIAKYLKKLKADGTGIIAVTHLINFASKISDQIVFIDRGKIIERGTGDLISKPRNQRTREFLEFF
ncbi:ATP-binding cassette domain-containing protein [bacterium]|nr:ATP-binding cassette domain-containing protein [bacterium]